MKIGDIVDYKGERYLLIGDASHCGRAQYDNNHWDYWLVNVNTNEKIRITKEQLDAKRAVEH